METSASKLSKPGLGNKFMVYKNSFIYFYHLYQYVFQDIVADYVVISK